ncbi:MAG TPA: FKBP-type peptidyl-prolyl cis-trans isomerase [Trebonia sp.]|nr:FKBP-type peptidyl-prolyl cis-trans isomerase [Trebonia sp.]
MNSTVKAAGAFGKAPSVTIPKAKPGTNLVTKTLVTGTGAALGSKDSLVGNFIVYDWSGTTSKEISSTWTAGAAPTLFTGGSLLPGLQTALVGKKVGSRVLAVLPPADGFGSQGNTQVGIKGTDTLVFVVDMIKAIPGNIAAVPSTTTFNGGKVLPTVSAAPGKPAVITIPSAKASTSLIVKPLVKGKGVKVATGDLAIVQYTGVVWKTGKPAPFDSSWTRSSPFGLTVGAGQVIKGWDDGLVGQTEGSRVMLVIPPGDGYGSSAQGSIPANSTLVFVLDIVGVYPTQPK